MKTIETKIAKNGTVNYYVDAKRVSRDTAIETADEQRGFSTCSINYDACDYNGNPVKESFKINRLNISVIIESLIHDIAARVYVNGRTVKSFIAAKFNDEKVKAAKAEARRLMNEISNAYIAGATEITISLGHVVETISEVDAAEYAITVEAQDVAIDAEIELANAVAEIEVQSGYIFTKSRIVSCMTDTGAGYSKIEIVNTPCKKLGIVEADIVGSVYLELRFFDENNSLGWKVTTTDGKLVASGKTEADAKKFLAKPQGEVVEEPAIDAVIAETQAKFDEAVADSKVDDFSTIKINGETVCFYDGKLHKIIAPTIKGEIVFNNGRREFWYNGYRQKSRAEFFKRLAEDAEIKAQFTEIEDFMRTHNAHARNWKTTDKMHAPFVATITPAVKCGNRQCEKTFVGFFDAFTDAKKFVDDFKAFAGEMKFTAYIKYGDIFGEICFKHCTDGNEVTIPPLTVEPELSEAEPSLEQSPLDELYHELAELNALRDLCLKSPKIKVLQLQALGNAIERFEREIEDAERDRRNVVYQFCKSGSVIDEFGEVFF